MNKTAIKNFAVWAREKLIKDIKLRAGMIGIDEKGIAEALPQSTKDLKFFDIGTNNYVKVSGDEVAQRDALVNAIKDKERKVSGYEEAFNYIVEEVAYTWFNRLIAIRFMEVNDYLPSGIRVLSSANKAKKEPDMVTTPFDTDLDFTPYEQDKIIQLKDENKLDELFRMLFIKQCNKLNELLPELFESIDDFSELLLSISFTDEDGIIYKLVHDIDEDDFNIEKEGQVEIIGWMYQYYNIEPKAAVFAKPKGTKIKKEEIPAATQLFTPDWIVRYMVENSLGRLWIEGHENDNLKSSWKYYLDEAKQETEVEKQLETIRKEYKKITPESIKLIDPCMGSGHILVYAFDVFMQIYESYGYTAREAAKSILENNIYGIDIDKRAYQLAYFAIMMKARQYNRRILTQGIMPNLVVTENSGKISNSALDRLNDCKGTALRLLDDFKNVEEYGSILNVSYSQAELDELTNKINDEKDNKNISDLMVLLEVDELKRVILPLVNQARVLSSKYHITVTNPPYMAVSGGSTKLQNYVKDNYPNSKTDLFAAFLEAGVKMTVKNGFSSMVTMQSWMFLSSYGKMRENMLDSYTLSNLMHMDNMVMGIAFGTAVSIFRNMRLSSYKGTYNQVLYKNIEDDIPVEFPVKGNRFSQVSTMNFSKIPGSPIAYWVSKNIISDFYLNKEMASLVPVKKGLDTGQNDKFLRYWFEVSFPKFGVGFESSEKFTEAQKKWAPHDKGGDFRRWYGNKEWVINWENNGYELHNSKANLRSKKLYFSNAITWGSLSSGKVSFRKSDYGAISNTAGSSLYPEEFESYYYIGLLNSNTAQLLFDIISPTLNYSAGSIGQIPIILGMNEKDKVIEISKENIAISKSDWDSFETSWDFVIHPLIRLRPESHFEMFKNTSTEVEYHTGNLKQAFINWNCECEDRFNTLKANEEELNRIFIDIYGLQDELTPEVEEKDVTVRKADLERDVKSFISYAVGCMFGRYSLDVDGLAYAGGEWDNSKYSSFIPDADNCIPITDEEYFEDDIVGRFVNFIKVVYGKETLEENLDFIAKALGTKGNTSREIIRNYFIKGFIKDHIKTYQKRPIYWLFDSGKQNGFKALVYMHRWNADTIGNMRVEYLHRTQRVYEKEMERMQEIIDNSRDNKEINVATKRKEKLQKQYKETKDYDSKVGHLALSRIDIDLDDGVKVNYNKVQTANDGTKHQILVKI